MSVFLVFAMFLFSFVTSVCYWNEKIKKRMLKQRRTVIENDME